MQIVLCCPHQIHPVSWKGHDNRQQILLHICATSLKSCFISTRPGGRRHLSNNLKSNRSCFLLYVMCTCVAACMHEPQHMCPLLICPRNLLSLTFLSWGKEEGRHRSDIFITCSRVECVCEEGGGSGGLVRPCFSKHGVKPQECSGSFFNTLESSHEPLGPLKETLI